MGMREISFEFRGTARNGPVQDFLKQYLDSLDDTPLMLSRETFERRLPKVFCSIEAVQHE
jgi:hypothetical protein